MKRDVILTGPARRDLGHLDRRVADRVLQAITRLAETGQGDITQLRGEGNERRLRVGDWRIRFALANGGQTIRILRVLPRGRAYRDRVGRGSIPELSNACSARRVRA